MNCTSDSPVLLRQGEPGTSQYSINTLLLHFLQISKGMVLFLNSVLMKFIIYSYSPQPAIPWEHVA